jgi:hypothetical protein
MIMHEFSRLMHLPKPVLTGSDIEIIGDAVNTLPGNWYLDPVIDLRRPGKPRVWLRSHAIAAFNLPAISFERIGRLVWVSICDPDTTECGMLTGQPFETIAAAFVYLWGRLEAMTAAGIGGPAPQ